MNRVIVVLGTQPGRNGTIFPDFRERIDHAVAEVALHPEGRNVVVLSGGHTVARCDSEAACGEVYLFECLRRQSFEDVVVVSEHQSKLSSESLTYVYAKLREHRHLWPNELLIVARKEQYAYVATIASCLDWGDDCTVTVTGVSGDYHGLEAKLYRYVLIPIVALLGPKVVSFLLWPVKMFARNGA